MASEIKKRRVSVQTKINRVLVLMFVLIASGAVNAQQSGGSFPGHDENNSASPQLNILRNPNPRADNSTNADLYRTFDGSDNNVASSELNKSATPLLRWTPSDYGDLKESMAGSSRPGPREISNAVSTQTESIINPNRASDFL